MITSSWWHCLLFLIPTVHGLLKNLGSRRGKIEKKKKSGEARPKQMTTSLTTDNDQSVLEVKSVLFSLPGSFMVPGHKYVGFGRTVFFLLSS